MASFQVWKSVGTITTRYIHSQSQLSPSTHAVQGDTRHVPSVYLIRKQLLTPSLPPDNIFKQNVRQVRHAKRACGRKTRGVSSKTA